MPFTSTNVDGGGAHRGFSASTARSGAHVATRNTNIAIAKTAIATSRLRVIRRRMT